MSDIRRLAQELRPWLLASLALPIPFYPRALPPYTANAADIMDAPTWRPMQPQQLVLQVFVDTTNNATNYWTIALSIINNNVVAAQGSINTSALTASSWQSLALTSFATPSWDALTAIAYLGITKTGTPGDLYVLPTLLVT
jgi:hypothetical protein